MAARVVLDLQTGVLISQVLIDGNSINKFPTDALV